MEFEWDPEKSERNFQRRGFDFEGATRIFEGFVLERPDTRRDYGEVRVVAIGVAEGETLTVVYTDRPKEKGRIVRRIISARRSNRRERKAYEDAI